MAGNRRAESSKEQTEEESARVGTAMVSAADRRVRGCEQRGKCRSNVRRPELAGKERTQGEQEKPQ